MAVTSVSVALIISASAIFCPYQDTCDIRELNVNQIKLRRVPVWDKRKFEVLPVSNHYKSVTLSLHDSESSWRLSNPGIYTLQYTCTCEPYKRTVVQFCQHSSILRPCIGPPAGACNQTSIVISCWSDRKEKSRTFLLNKSILRIYRPG